MHILFLTDNFPPEVNAPATRTYEHALEWVRQGCRVTVVTGAPNFPDGHVHQGYANAWYQREDMDGIEVVRVKTYIAPNSGSARRILDYLSFMVMGTLGGLRQDRPDVVVATSPQFFTAVAGRLVAWGQRAPFVFELRDLWPASITAVGAMRKGLAMRLLERLELFLYRSAAAVVTVTHSFREDLVSRGIRADKIEVVTNGVDLSRYAPRERDADLAAELGIGDRFVVGYLGTHGMAHALGRVLEAAERLRDRDDIRILFLGAGAARQELIERRKELGLANVLLLPPVTKAEMPRYWSLCSVALVHLKNTPVFETVIPSKLFEAMGMGVPILYAGPDGEAPEIVRSNGAGVWVPPEDPERLAEAIAALASDPGRRRKLAAGSLAAASAFSRARLAQALLRVLARVAGRPVALPAPEQTPAIEVSERRAA